MGKSHLTKSAVPAYVSSLGLLGIFHRTAKMRGNPDSLSRLLVVQSAPSAPLGKITEWAHRHTERLHKAQYPALLLVIGSMIAYYRFAGLVASVAVIFNLLILWATLQNIGATLSLAGIAGIILTVGMAVDANVLVFERIKEEFAETGKIGAAIGKALAKPCITNVWIPDGHKDTPADRKGPRERLAGRSRCVADARRALRVGRC